MPSDLCPDCGTEVAPGFLSCPGCRRLVHSDRLKRLAVIAEQSEQAGDATAAQATWREALTLLPPDSKQHQAIVGRIEAVQKMIATARPKGSSALAKGAAGAGALGLLLWKFKFVALFLLGKGKLLLLGLTKLKTILSMFVFFAAYWSTWGWKFAAGLVVSIYIHEMGHIAKLRAYGIRAEPPMFIPGLGAFVRLKQYPASPVEDARVGLAGPLWGLGAAIASFLLFLATEAPIWAAIGRMGAAINLFNLIPVWQLDGGRGFRSLTRTQRWVASAVVAAALFFSGQGVATTLLLLILLGAVYRSVVREPVEKSDLVGLVQYIVLVVSLTALTLIPIPGFPPSSS